MPFPFSEYPLSLQDREGKTYVKDPLRQQWMVLTPEEYVRQQVIQFLLQEKQITRGRISVERGLKYQRMQKRYDLLIFNRSGQPHILCECKAPEVKLTQETLHQVARYNQELKAPHLLITNGNQWLFFSKNEKGTYQFQPAGWEE